MYEPASRNFKVTFLVDDKNVSFEVDPAEVPFDLAGLPGSVLDIAFGAGIVINHPCGGVSACTACHVIVREGFLSCNDMVDDELDMLKETRGVGFTSRLACQCVPNGTTDLVVEVPNWP